MCTTMDIGHQLKHELCQQKQNTNSTVKWYHNKFSTRKRHKSETVSTYYCTTYFIATGSRGVPNIPFGPNNRQNELFVFGQIVLKIYQHNCRHKRGKHRNRNRTVHCEAVVIQTPCWRLESQHYIITVVLLRQWTVLLAHHPTNMFSETARAWNNYIWWCKPYQWATNIAEFRHNSRDSLLRGHGHSLSV